MTCSLGTPTLKLLNTIQILLHILGSDLAFISEAHVTFHRIVFKVILLHNFILPDTLKSLEGFELCYVL